MPVIHPYLMRALLLPIVPSSMQFGRFILNRNAGRCVAGHGVQPNMDVTIVGGNSGGQAYRVVMRQSKTAD